MKMKKMMKVVVMAMMVVLLGAQMKVLACDCICEACKNCTEKVSPLVVSQDDTAEDLERSDDERRRKLTAITSAKPSKVLGADEIDGFVPEDTYLLNLDTGELFYEKDLGEKGGNEEATAVEIVAGQHYETGFALRNDLGENLYGVRLHSNGVWFLDELDKTVYWPCDRDLRKNDQIAAIFSSRELGTDSGYKTGIRAYAKKPIVLWLEGSGAYTVHNSGLSDGKTLAPGIVAGLKGAEIGPIEKDQFTWITTRWEAKLIEKWTASSTD